MVRKMRAESDCVQSRRSLVTLGRCFSGPGAGARKSAVESMGRPEAASEKLARKVGGGGWWSEGFREARLDCFDFSGRDCVFLIPEGNGWREPNIMAREERADGEKLQVKRQGPDAKHRGLRDKPWTGAALAAGCPRRSMAGRLLGGRSWPAASCLAEAIQTSQSCLNLKYLPGKTMQLSERQFRGADPQSQSSLRG